MQKNKIIMSVSFQQIAALFSMHLRRPGVIILSPLPLKHECTNMYTQSHTRKEELFCATGNRVE